MRNLTLAATLAAAAAAFAAPALADEIRFPGGRAPLTGVEIVSENYETVVYKIKGSNQSEATPNILEIVHSNKTQRYDTAEKKFAKGEYAAALKDFQGVLGDRLRDEQAWMKHYALFYVAECQRLSGDVRGAVESYEAVIKDNDKSRFYAPVKLGIGRCKLSMSDKAGAKQVFNELKTDAGSKKLGDRWAQEASLALAEVLESEGKLKEAIDLYSKVPGAKAAIKASALRAQDDPSKADFAASELEKMVADEYKKKPEVGPDFEILAAAYNALGDVYDKKGDAKRALLAYLRVALEDEFRKFSDERPKALYCAAQAFEKAKTEDWKPRSEQLRRELKEAYPGSIWAKK